jgi:hypothetical protein
VNNAFQGELVVNRLIPLFLLFGVALLALGSIVSGAAPEAAADKPLFHSDPDHVWNRLHKHVSLRGEKNVGVDDREPLSPHNGPMSSFLIKGKSHEETMALLNEFLKLAPQRRVKEPLQRAVVQHDLWEAFTSTTEEARLLVYADVEGRVRKTQHFVDPGDERLEDRRPRRAVQRGLAQALRAVALSPREIEELPDNLAAAVKAGTFPKEFDQAQPEQPFLPADLLAKDGPWVAVASTTRSDELAAPAHMAAAKGRAVFTVFLRLPEGRKATEGYLKKMKDGALPDLPEGSQTALLKRWLLIDDQGRPRETPLTESLQLRVYWKSDDGRPFVFRLRREELFAGRGGGLQPVSLKNESCSSCHARQVGHGVHTIATLYAGDANKPGLIPVGAGEQSKHTVDWLTTTYTWGLLQGMWETEPAK